KSKSEMSLRLGRFLRFFATPMISDVFLSDPDPPPPAIDSSGFSVHPETSSPLSHCARYSVLDLFPSTSSPVTGRYLSAHSSPVFISEDISPDPDAVNNVDAHVRCQSS